MAAKKDPKNNLKNKSKAEGGWCTDDLFFDEEGCLYVPNKALADAIKSSMDAWKNRLKIYRDPPPAPPTPIEKGQYPAAVLAAVNLGGDTDTTGAVAGGLAGLRCGVAGIPTAWIDALARRDEVVRLAETFADACLAAW